MLLLRGVALICLVFLAAAAAVPKSASAFKIYAAGSGLDMLSLPETVAEILALSGRPNPAVLYLGTATYDDPKAQATQTQSFIAAGCTVSTLKVALAAPSQSAMQAAFAKADIVLVSGGNTLFAVDRFVKVGIPALITSALASGAVLCGGSAGGIVWFDGGHSDSMEPASYKNSPGPLLNPAKTVAEMDAWSYIRAPGLGVLPGFFCPHYDVTESNGQLRSTSFTDLLRGHSGESGIAVDNWGALVVNGSAYRVISRAGKPGSVGPLGDWTANNTKGRPGMWTLSINHADGSLERTLAPATGLTKDLLAPAHYIVQSQQLSVARAQNPDDGIPPSSFEMEVYT